MTRRMVLATLALSFLGFPVGDLLACGDKFLVVGRGARYQRGYVAVHPGSVLLVDTRRISGQDLLIPLRRAGHRVDVVHSDEELRRAIGATSYDVVLAELSSARDVQSVVTSMAPSALFVPVIDRASPAELEAAKKAYGCPLESAKPQMNRTFLARLDEVIDAKRKSKPLSCKVN